MGVFHIPLVLPHAVTNFGVNTFNNDLVKSVLFVHISLTEVSVTSSSAYWYGVMIDDCAKQEVLDYVSKMSSSVAYFFIKG